MTFKPITDTPSGAGFQDVILVTATPWDGMLYGDVTGRRVFD
jgi:hypothetical protein